MSDVIDVQQIVARSADVAGLHATAPAQLLELQTQLGVLAATATAATERGRRPFRPTPDWAQRLGQLAYGLYLIADQTGVDVAREVAAAASLLERRAEQRTARAHDDEWPVQAS